MVDKALDGAVFIDTDGSGCQPCHSRLNRVVLVKCGIQPGEGVLNHTGWSWVGATSRQTPCADIVGLADVTHNTHQG